MRAWHAQRAAERQVDADIVLTNDALMSISRAAPTTIEALASVGVMGEWKLQEYGPELLAFWARRKRAMVTSYPEIRLGDIVRMRKPHPCGGTDWEVVRLGADIGIRCQGCSRRVLLPRSSSSARSRPC